MVVRRRRRGRRRGWQAWWRWRRRRRVRRWPRDGEGHRTWGTWLENKHRLCVSSAPFRTSQSFGIRLTTTVPALTLLQDSRVTGTLHRSSAASNSVPLYDLTNYIPLIVEMFRLPRTRNLRQAYCTGAARDLAYGTVRGPDATGGICKGAYTRTKEAGSRSLFSRQHTHTHAHHCLTIH